MTDQKNNFVFSLLAAFTLLVIVATQVVSHANFHFDVGLTEAIDFEDSEDEKDLEEEKSEEKIAQDQHFDSSKSTPKLISEFYFLNRVPTQPHLETVSPPPDCA